MQHISQVGGPTNPIPVALLSAALTPVSIRYQMHLASNELLT
jgi:hypothetical protein